MKLSGNFTKGIQWNVTEPAITGTQSILRVNTVDSLKFCSSLWGKLWPVSGYTIEMDMAYSAVNGALLWGPINRTQLVGTSGSGVVSNSYVGIDDGVYVVYEEATFDFWGYSITNGSALWGPTLASPTVSGWASYGGFRDQWSAMAWFT